MKESNLSGLPILITCFNRPDLLRQTLVPLKNSPLPLRIYFHIDGARPVNETDQSFIDTSIAIIEEFAMDRQVQIKVQPMNLGMREAMLSAISWFFSMEEYGLILEEDVVVHPGVLPLVLETLQSNQDNHNVGAISLHNLLPSSLTPINCDAYLTNIVFIWGWGTWRRVWANTRHDLSNVYQRCEETQVKRQIGLFGYFYFLKFLLRKAKSSWDGSFMLSLWERKLKTIHFCESLCTNIGFDERATNTKEVKFGQRVPPADIEFSWQHIRLQSSFDKQFEKKLVSEVFGLNGFRIRTYLFRWYLREYIRFKLKLSSAFNSDH